MGEGLILEDSLIPEEPKPAIYEVGGAVPCTLWEDGGYCRHPDAWEAYRCCSQNDCLLEKRPVLIRLAREPGPADSARKDASDAALLELDRRMSERGD